MAWQNSTSCTSLRMSTSPTSWRTSMRGWVLKIEVTFNIDDNDILIFNIDDNGNLNDVEKGHPPQVEFDSLWQKAKQFRGEDKNNKIEVMKNLENYCLIPYHALNDPLRPRTRTTRKRPCRELCRDEPP
ncbi:unnamed protein product [Polarella glacialis]|uniref:Uncharacterized protein n=1 Tax=Polarella glacialis TaxID=89957 RepID=A0A813HKE3_POLGL|nr:unnamed protein product [Polarella glacialis]CAE8643499.1 unnamed protein product [Polarella glacialis]